MYYFSYFLNCCFSDIFYKFFLRCFSKFFKILYFCDIFQFTFGQYLFCFVSLYLTFYILFYKIPRKCKKKYKIICILNFFHYNRYCKNMKQGYLTEYKQGVNVLFCPFVYVPFTLIFFYKLLLYSLYQYNVFMNILHTIKGDLLHKAKGQNRAFTICPLLLSYIIKMENYLSNYKQKTLEKLIEAKEYTQEQVKILKSIKRIHKKDGKEFKDLLKNFSSDLGRFSYFHDNLYFKSLKASVYLKTYFNLAYEDDKRQKYEKEAPERIVKEPCLVDRVFLNADELEQEIQDKIAFYENYLKEQTKSVKNFEKEYGKIEKAYGKLVEAINETNETAYYEYKNMVKTCL